MSEANSQKHCFVISPICEDESETRKRADQVLKHIIKPATEACGYKATRADEIDKPELITSHVIQRVANDDLVIADLTETNPNVFYELAIRHAIRRPLIQIIGKGERIPFDIAGLRTIHFDHQDLDSVSDVKTNIENQIKELENNPDDIETPVSVSLELQILRQSENPGDRDLADIIDTISELRSMLQGVNQRTEEDDRRIANMVARHVYWRLREEEVHFPGHPRMLRRFSPKFASELLYDLAHNARAPGSLIAFVSSLFRDMAPWVYELGMAIYRQELSQKTRAELLRLYDNYFQIADMTLSYPLMREKPSNTILYDAVDLLR